MNLAGAEALADALLFEGYMLYPYRSSALKNYARWTFGVIEPNARLLCECLALGTSATQLELRVRCLVPTPDGQGAQPCDVTLGPVTLATLSRRLPFAAHGVQGELELTSTSVLPGVHRLLVQILNSTKPHRLMVSTHALLSLDAGEFVAPRDPPDPLRALSEACRTEGLWPILVGEPGARHLMLCAPIILDDYPRIAPESPGDLFDGTEIDEILTLRILTLTEAERAEIARGDPRVTALIERTESLDEDALARLHGRLRSAPRTLRVGNRDLGRGDRVRLRPIGRADIFDIALAGRLATIESVEQDVDNRSYFAVTIDDDPGRDLGTLRQTGHRFFFAPEEVEVMPSAPSG